MINVAIPTSYFNKADVGDMILIKLILTEDKKLEDQL